MDTVIKEDINSNLLEEENTIDTHDTMNKLEAILFTLADPVKLKKISEILEIDFNNIRNLAKVLNENYSKNNSSFEIIEINSSLQIVVKNKYGNLIDSVINNEDSNILTNAQLEVLSVIAYKQPVTRRDIELIRGVKSDKIVSSLIELELVVCSGVRNSPGQPQLFKTTDGFLRKFGLKNLKDLPNTKENENTNQTLFI